MTLSMDLLFLGLWIIVHCTLYLNWVLKGTCKEIIIKKHFQLIRKKQTFIEYNSTFVLGSREPSKIIEKILTDLSILKIIYSEKATKFCVIFPLLLTVCTVVKSKGEILQNFVAFSECMNFTASGFVQRGLCNAGNFLFRTVFLDSHWIFIFSYLGTRKLRNQNLE